MTSTTPAGAGLEDVDLADPDRFIDRVPFEMLALLRREDPVHWQEEPDGSGFWAVMKHADIRTVHKDYKTYSSERGGTSLQDLDPEQLEARKSMIDTDPPRHFKLRALINKNFTPNAVRGHEAAIRELISEIADRALELGEMEFVSEVSAELPMRVFAEMLGARRRTGATWSTSAIASSAPTIRAGRSEELRKNRHLPFSSPAAGEMFEYGRAWPRSVAASRAMTSSPASYTPSSTASR